MVSPYAYSISEFSSNEPSEDRYVVRIEQDVSIYCVIDGHGGCFACELAQKYLIDMLMEEIEKHDVKTVKPDVVLQLFETAFKKCDDTILQEAIRIQSEPNRILRYPGRVGCCVAIAAIIAGRLYTAHVGDCRVVLCRDSSNPRMRSAADKGLAHTETAAAPEYPDTTTSPHAKRARRTSSRFSASSAAIQGKNRLGSGRLGSPFYVRDFHAESISALRSKSSATRRPASDEEDEFTSFTSSEDTTRDVARIVGNDSMGKCAAEPSSVVMSQAASGQGLTVNLVDRGCSAPHTQFTNVPSLSANESVTSLPQETATAGEGEGGCAATIPGRSPSLPLCKALHVPEDNCRGGECSGGDVHAPPSGMVGDEGACEKLHKQRSGTKRKAPIETEYDFTEYSALISTQRIHVHCLTKDHSCDDKSELRGIRYLCPSDPGAVRPSSNDKMKFGRHALKRVGGSLSVTRALGDGYLKIPFLSEEPYIRHVPYITCLPSVSCRLICAETDLALVIASDGLWNYMEPVDVAVVLRLYLDKQEQIESVRDKELAADKINMDSTSPGTAETFAGPCQASTSNGAALENSVQSHVAGLLRCRNDYSDFGIQDTSPDESSDPSKQLEREGNQRSKAEALLPSTPSPAVMLLERCLRNAALAGGTTYEALQRMPCGPYKRNIVDDITIIVVLLGGENGECSSA